MQTAQTPLLSISIPTYNRYERLRELLWGLCLQITALSDAQRAQVNIYINDNASDDDTLAVVEKFRAQYPFITWHRNDKNLGADANVALSVARPTGTFVWLLCDDDLPVKGAVKTILARLEALEKATSPGEPGVGLVHLNGHHRNVEMTAILQRQIDTRNPDVFTLPGEAFLCQFHNALLRGSTLIFRKDYADGAFAKVHLYDYLCSPMVLALQCLSQGPGSFIQTPLITYRENHKPWFTLWPIIDGYYLPLLVAKAVRAGLFTRQAARVFARQRNIILRKWLFKIKKFSTEMRNGVSNDPAAKANVDLWQLILLYWHQPWFWDECIWFALLPFPAIEWLLKHSPIKNHLPTPYAIWLTLKNRLKNRKKTTPAHLKLQEHLQSLQAQLDTLEDVPAKVA
ncbi:MAG: glycosyltransferase family 2 protein [Vampirovibrionales bacterium]|nr:glycosyltransferase family 2 protein [Vampirovibrionales bacterium]